MWFGVGQVGVSGVQSVVDEMTVDHASGNKPFVNLPIAPVAPFSWK